MNRPHDKSVQFSLPRDQLASVQVIEYRQEASRAIGEVVTQTSKALAAPLDFPALDLAVVEGDRVALAVDPNVPQLIDVIVGAAEILFEAGVGDIDVVLWDEASDRTYQSLGDAIKERSFGDRISVHRHDSADRESLRYLAADADGQPLYLNRVLVDAELVVPIVSQRPLDNACRHDLTGVYPSFADSATRYRHGKRMQSLPEKDREPEEQQVRWLLGVQLLIAVAANSDGNAAEIIAGTPEAVAKQWHAPLRSHSDSFPPAAPLVIASLDGDARQQTWQNAARAAAAASRFTEPGGTIVVWTEIDTPPSPFMSRMMDRDPSSELDQLVEETPDIDSESESRLPVWDASISIASTLLRIATDYRVMIHADIDAEAVESMGLGWIRSEDELRRLADGLETCGVLRAAQFAGSTFDAPLRLAAIDRV